MSTTLPPVAPPLASTTAVSGNVGSLTPSSDQVSKPTFSQRFLHIIPSWNQVVVLYVVCHVIFHFILPLYSSPVQIVAMAVIIFGFWNVPVVRNFINPLKLFTIGWHELCHISAVCTHTHIYIFLLPL